MWSSILVLSLLLLTGFNCKQTVTKDLEYEPNWKSLDHRPLPQWYEDAKIGIFIHWGVFSVPSFGSEWFWNNWKGTKNVDYINFMKKNYPPNFTYQDFGPQFTAELFDPNQWADLFAASGAQYIVLTSKHHEGYCLWPSKHSFSWNSMDVGPQRDIIGDLAVAIKQRTDLKFGLYHSLYEWFNPLWLQDKANNFSTNYFVTQKTLPELYELVNTYNPEVIWSDGEWEAPDTYWQSKEFLAWLFNDSPVRDTVVVNDRWGHETLCKHGDFYTCTDRFNPGELQRHKWENAMTLDKKSWGFRHNANISDYMTMRQLLNETISTISCGGNILINVGPTKEGTIAPIFQERLIDLGKWLAVNGAAMYKSRPWHRQKDLLTPDVWYTQKLDSKQWVVFAAFLNWPKLEQVLVIENDRELFTADSQVVFLNGNEIPLSWMATGQKVVIELPPKHVVTSEWCWVVKISAMKSNEI